MSKNNQMITAALDSMRARFGCRIHYEPGSEARGIPWTLLDSEGYILVMSKNRRQFLRDLQVFRDGVAFGVCLPEA